MKNTNDDGFEMYRYIEDRVKNRGTKPVQAEQAAHAETLELGIKKTSNAFINLWDRAAPHLTGQELEWFSCLSENAELEVQQLASITESIGFMIADDETGSFDSSESVSDLLYSISNRLDTIHGLLHIASRAKDKLDK
jgi:hypothetical protein